MPAAPDVRCQINIPTLRAKERQVSDGRLAAGQDHQIRPFGLMATESMRLEKGYRHWKADLITEFNPMESGLERFVDMSKSFIGKDGLLSQQPRAQFVSLDLQCDDAPAHPGDSITCAGKVVGTVTSAGWGHRTGTNIAFGFAEPTMGDNELGILHLGRITPATLAPMCRYDQNNTLMRG